MEPTGLLRAYVGEDGSSGVRLLRSITGERFRVSATVAPADWRVTEQRSLHLGYDVVRAVGGVEGDSVEAWFAPDIPVSAGPALYGGLPGMILVLSLKREQGRTTYTATEVRLEGVEDGLIRMTDEGEAKSLEEYRSFISREITAYVREFRDIARQLTDAECFVSLAGSELKWECMEQPSR